MQKSALRFWKETPDHFLRLDGDATFYSISAAECTDVVIMNVGDAVTISYAPTATGSILDAYSASWTGKESDNHWQAPENTEQETPMRLAMHHQQ